MDSSSEIAAASESNQFIMDLGVKSTKSYVNNGSSLTFQDGNENSSSINDKVVPYEQNHVTYNGDASHGEETNLRSNHDTSSRPKCSSNSSQCSLNNDTVCDSISNELSSLNINTDDGGPTETTNSRLSDSNYANCDSKNPVEYQNSAKEESSSSDVTTTVADQTSLCDECEKKDDNSSEIMYICYESEHQISDIMKLIQKDLSEPYSIYTYRYFIHNWPHLCFLVSTNARVLLAELSSL